MKREGIELTSAFTADGQRRPAGGLAGGTITVTGDSPTVDIQNVTQQKVMTRDVLNAIPAGMKSTGQIGVLIPGVTSTSQDVGGTAFSAVGLAIHGSRLNEQAALYDGMNFNNGQGRGGQFIAIVTNDATVQEMAIETAGLSAEAEASGVKINLVPRDGGNTFKGLILANYSDHNLQANNLSDGLIARGLTSSTTVKRSYDIDPAFGGPLMKDKLWFWGSVRAQAAEQTVAGIYYNLTPTGHAYTPDLSRPADSLERNQNESLRLTWQVNAKNKLNVQHQNASQQRPFYGYSLGQLTSAPEAIYYSKSAPMYQSQATWNSPVTSKLLLEGGVLYNNKDYPTQPQPTNAPDQVAYSDSGTGFNWGNYTSFYGHNASHNFNTRFAASYVTGSQRLQGRRQLHAPVGVDLGGRRQQRHGARLAERRAAAGDGLGDAVFVLRDPQPELGRLRAGSVDAEAGDDQRRPPFRLSQRRRPRADARSRSAGADAQYFVRRSDRRARLEERHAEAGPRV